MKYKVIALSVGGLGNKIFNHGDEVTEDNFPRGNAAKLVERRFIEPIEEEKIAVVLDNPAKGNENTPEDTSKGNKNKNNGPKK